MVNLIQFSAFFDKEKGPTVIGPVWARTVIVEWVPFQIGIQFCVRLHRIGYRNQPNMLSVKIKRCSFATRFACLRKE
jgi:hypothetical protein